MAMLRDLPKTFKAAVVEEANKPFVFKELPLELPKEGQVLIKVLACGVCHTDAVQYAGQFGPLPRIMGHEIVGDVVAVPPSEKKWKVGERVGGTWHGGNDGTCKACIKGYTQMCDNAQVNGISKDGGYAEYCTLNTEAVVSVPANLDPVQVAPFLCAGVTVFRGIKQMNVPAGEIVAVQGLGGLGHLAIQYARKLGYRTVALSTSNSKRDFAAQLGANDYVDGSKEDTVETLTKLGGASLIVATAPHPETIQPLVNGLGPNGKLLILAPLPEIQVSPLGLIPKGRSVHGWPSGTPHDCEDALEFANLQDVKCLVEPYPFAKAQQAFDDMLAGKPRFRAVLTF
ncbi:MAG: hypothetical protein M1820_003246 [Bogoriella megaspora]|nr:MAG: hypothetical protein M1820_003246 [Bogoriella megaspora]